MQISHKSDHIFICQDDLRCITINFADNIVKLWNIDVRYHQHEDSKLISEWGAINFSQFFTNKQDINVRAAACAFDSIVKKWIYALASGSEIVLLDNNFKVVDNITNLYQINELRI